MLPITAKLDAVYVYVCVLEPDLMPHIKLLPMWVAIASSIFEGIDFSGNASSTSTPQIATDG